MSSSATAGIRTYKNYVNGEWVASASGETFPIYDPSTEEVVAHVAAAGAADVNLARTAPSLPKSNAAIQASPSSKRNTTSPMSLLALNTTAASPTKFSVA